MVCSRAHMASSQCRLQRAHTHTHISFPTSRCCAHWQTQKISNNGIFQTHLKRCVCVWSVAYEWSHLAFLLISNANEQIHFILLNFYFFFHIYLFVQWISAIENNRNYLWNGRWSARKMWYGENVLFANSPSVFELIGVANARSSRKLSCCHCAQWFPVIRK